ncbi:MAG TPA: protein kinase [Chloroflexia bacterium]|nr:protein kinase [Chloroflexia bacterium]
MSSDSPSNKTDWSYLNSASPASSEKPRVIGDRYELLELVGRGGMSRIYRARDRRLQRIVAVKLLLEEHNRDPSSVARFNREARSLAALSSPYIVEVFDYGQEEDVYYLVMEFIEGTNLKELIRSKGAFGPQESINIINQVLLALETAHSHGIIHRDVKPQNILIQSGTGQVKLTDFGVARAPDDMSITTVGTTIGTVQYMSPEQSSGEMISPASDVYSAGVVLYELLTGRLPFEGSSPMQIALQHLHDPPPALSSLGLNLPPALEQVVMRALTKNPAQRYHTAEEMRQALSGVFDKASNPAQPSPDYQEPYYPTESLPITPADTATREYRPPLKAQKLRPQERKPAGRILPLVIILLLIAGGVLAWLIFTGRPESSLPGAATSVGSSKSSPVAGSSGNAASGTLLTIKSDQLSGAYRRTDGTLYGRQEVALYGSGSNYNEGKVTFKLNSVSNGSMTLRLTGLDDERPAQCGLQVVLNGKTIFDGANTFPKVRDGDNGEGGGDRYWGQMQIPVPPGSLRQGSNDLIIRNTTNWLGYLGIPYMLINSVDFVAG